MKRKLLIMLIAIACIFCIVFAFSACETTNFKSSIDNNGASTIKPDTEEHVHIEVIDEAVAPTCTTYGLTEGKHCSVCGAVLVAQTLIDKVDHNIVTETAVSPTCTSFGWTEGKYCKDCGTVIEPRVQISMTAHIEVVDEATPATCAEFGLSEGKHCAVCGLVTVPQIKTSKLAHTEVIDKAVEPTCSQFGYTKGSHCGVCGMVLVEQIKIDKLAHTVVLDEAVEATCENSGLTEGSHCSVCGEIIVAQEQIPALAHTYGTDNFCDFCGHDILEYTLTEDGTGYEVSARSLMNGDEYFSQTAKTIYIAEMHKGLPVTAIATSAFKDFTHLEKIYIPDTVNTINQMAFIHCDSLKYIDLPENLLIDSQAFTYSGLVEVTIPASTIGVGNNAFISCRSLEKVTIGGGDIKFGGNTFALCTSLTTVILEEGLTTLSFGMFAACKSLKELTIPASVYSIDRNAVTYVLDSVKFENPDGWNAYNPMGDTKVFTAEELSDPVTAAQLLYTYRYYTWWKIAGGIPDIPNHEHVYTWEVVADFTCPAPYGMKEGNCTCGAAVISIISTVHVYDEDGICEGCGRSMIEYTLNDEGTGYIVSKVDRSLTEVIIPATYNDLPVVEIGHTAFHACYSLVSVVIPDSVTTIGYGAFYYCSALTEIDLNNVTAIGRSAFGYCTELRTVNLHKVVSIEGISIFQRCDNLEKIIYDGTIEEWKAVASGHGFDSDRIGDYVVYCTDGQLNKGDF